MHLQNPSYSLLLISLLASATSAQYGGPGGSSGGAPGGGAAASHYSPIPSYYHHVVIAHGVLASLAWVIFFPLGAILIRVASGPYAFRIHFAIQACSILIFTAAVGMGIWMAKLTHRLSNYHAIIGLVMFAVISVTVTAALLHHYVLYPKVRKRTHMARLHLWLGRILITLGMINGGLGLKISSGDGKYGAKVASKGEYVAYGVVSGIMLLAYVIVVTYYETKTPRVSVADAGHSRLEDKIRNGDGYVSSESPSSEQGTGEWYGKREEVSPPERSRNTGYTITNPA